jgi:uncharacterized protein YaeQ
MALKATIHKARLQLADLDRGVYLDRSLTLARHPSETDERMLVRLLAWALHTPADDTNGALDFGKSLWDGDEPDLWQKDLTGRTVHWIDVGLPDERRLLRAASRADRVSVLAYASSTPLWWRTVAGKLARVRNVAVWQIDAAQSQALAALAGRTMHWHVMVQDGLVSVNDGERVVELAPLLLTPTPARS